jgi:small conductance mechanosensitive channel
LDEAEMLELLAGSVTIVVVTGVATEVFSKTIGSLARRSGARESTIKGISYFTRIAWLLIAATYVLYYTGLSSVFTTLTVSGIGGVAVSLALQSTLSNMISGILLLHDKAVRLDDDLLFNGVRGRVVRIALRNTWIRTGEGTLVLVSNTNLANGPLVNFTAAGRLKDLG